jgi:hypothetical protein
METQSRTSSALALCRMGLENQQWIERCLNAQWVQEAKQFQRLDGQLFQLFLQQKTLGRSQYYIWHTQDDGKVRPAHAANDEGIFAWDYPPATGHPGEDYNCRCWAEPVGDTEYARQVLITPVNDNPNKWTNENFVFHYLLGGGVPLTLESTGYLGDIIEYFATHAIAKDGKVGGYRAVEEQIIKLALDIRDGEIPYGFEQVYDFEDMKYTFRNSTIIGNFSGHVRTQGEYLIINGVMSYDFKDKFEDPGSAVEALTRYLGWTREDAQEFVRDNAPDLFVAVYDFTGHWKTKLNATIRISSQ